VAASTRTRKASPAQLAERDQKLAAAHERLTAGIAELTSGEAWAAMLAASSRFHQYSLNNVLMILSQCPEATQVASYKRWTELGRQVRKGEHGIAIFAPMTYRPREDEVDANAQRDSQGRPAQRVRGFRLVPVFDISQTDGDPIEPTPRRGDFATLLKGQAPEGAWDVLAKIVADQGFSLVRVADASVIGGANGRTDYSTREVLVRSDVSDAQACKTLAHEVAHILLGHEHTLGADRSRKEVEAESVAFLVGDAVGLDTSGYTFGYVAGWAAEGEVADELASTAKRVLEVARKVIAELDGTESGVAA
jgi:hypothetical protein